MLKKILLVLVIAVVAFAGYVAMQPDVLHIERQARVAAPAAAVFAQVNDVHKWEAWSPWTELDPGAKVGFEGPAAGKDAVLTWAGNEKIGAGRMTIVESRPDELVDIKVDFTQPFEASSKSTFSLKPEGDATLVTWTSSGKQNFIEKAICIVANGKKMVGGEMEKGLAKLKAAAEGTATPQ